MQALMDRHYLTRVMALACMLAGPVLGGHNLTNSESKVVRAHPESHSHPKTRPSLEVPPPPERPSIATSDTRVPSGVRSVGTNKKTRSGDQSLRGRQVRAPGAGN